MAGCARRRTASPMRLTAHGIKRGDRVAILLPQAPEVAAIHIAIYKIGAIALPLATLFGTDALAYRLQNAGASALFTNAQGLAKIAEIRRAQADALAGLKLLLSVDGPGEGALGIAQALERASADFTAARHRSRRPGDDDLHLGHHGAAQGRAARPSRADRPHAGHRTAPGVLPAAGRPVLDPGGLGLGRRPARLPAAEPLLRRAGGGAPLRQVRPGGGLCGDGALWRAQRLHPADGAADAARGSESARASRHHAPLGRLRRRGARRRDLRMGQGCARRLHQRVLRPDRVQPGGRLLRLDRPRAARCDRQGHPRARGRGDRRRGQSGEGGRDRPDRGASGRTR